MPDFFKAPCHSEEAYTGSVFGERDAPFLICTCLTEPTSYIIKFYVANKKLFKEKKKHITKGKMT